MTSGELADGLNRLIKAACVGAKSLQSYLTLCNPMHCRPPGSSVHDVLQARMLEQVAISSQPRDWTLICLLHWQAGSLPLVPAGKPLLRLVGENCLKLFTLQGSSTTLLPREGFLSALPAPHFPLALSSLISPLPFLQNRPSLGFL